MGFILGLANDGGGLGGRLSGVGPALGAGQACGRHPEAQRQAGDPGRYRFRRGCGEVNSYRRFGSQFYVPNAPSWGLDNRTVALRVPTGSPDAVRLEHRVAGADANPYLLLASVLAGVHHGLTNKVEPGAPIEGNSYEQLEPSLPNNLRDALRELDDSEILAKYIDPKYIDIFVACKESELEEFEYSISDLEYNWYLHTV